MVNKIINWIQKQRDGGYTYVNFFDILNLYPKEIQTVAGNVLHHLQELDHCFTRDFVFFLKRNIPYSLFLEVDANVSSIATEFQTLTGTNIFSKSFHIDQIENKALVLHFLIEQCFILKTKPFLSISSKFFIKENLEEELRIDFSADFVRCNDYQGTFSDYRIREIKDALVGKKVRSSENIKALRNLILFCNGGLMEAFKEKIDVFVINNFEKLYFIEDQEPVEYFPMKDIKTIQRGTFEFEFLHYGNFSFETHRKFLGNIGNKFSDAVTRSFLKSYKEESNG